MLRRKIQVSHTAVAEKFSYRLGGRVQKKGFSPRTVPVWLLRMVSMKEFMLWWDREGLARGAFRLWDDLSTCDRKLSERRKR
jgi:hypothetical protein